ncbi:ATP-binding protein [Aurantimonas marina]|uniref:ATP-binding protein n=1 Tax=Aurantimonas marina TaxID=2780508 RepID=UPI0019D21870|nr:ATP-binding protein [Aurantimonas marina]
MATPTVPIALAIMAHPQVREANSASTALAVFSSDLTRLLWTNSAGARLLQLDAAGPQPADAQINTAPIRQIRAAGRMLAAVGHAKALVRPLGGGLGPPATAELRPISGGQILDDFVLVSVSGLPSSHPTVDDPTILADETLDPETLAAFRVSTDTHRVVARDDGSILMLAKLDDERVLVWVGAAPQRQGAEADGPTDDDIPGTDGADPTSSPRDVALEPQADPDDKRSDQIGKMGMSALLQRWYFRNRDGGTSMPEPEAATEPDEADSVNVEAAVTDAAAHEREGGAGPTGDDRIVAAVDADGPTIEQKDESIDTDRDTSRDGNIPAITSENTLMPAPGPQQPYDAHAAAASPPRPLRSSWGTPARPTPDALPTEQVPESDRAANEGQPTPPEPVADDTGSRRRDLTASVPLRDEQEGDRAASAGDLEEADDGVTETPFSPRLDVVSVRFVWRIDSEGRFRSLSPEFAAAVGPRSADVIDQSFHEVAAAYGIDTDGEVGRLLDRRDTWSGRTVYWPLENTAKRVPIDLAALPVYARDRSFDGFRGFGIARLADAVEDPEAIGLGLGARSNVVDHALDESLADDSVGRSREIGGRALLKRFSSEEREVSFGRRDPADRPDTPPDRVVPKIIRLEERRRSKDGDLSQDEEAAFRAIGQTLAHEDAPSRLGQAIQTATRRIDELENARANGQVSAEAASEAGRSPDPDNEMTTAKEPVEDAGDGGQPPAEAVVDAAGSDGNGRDDGDDDTDTNSADMLSSDKSALLAELKTVYADLPLPVLVQVREDIIYGNREFLDLTGYETVTALGDAGGLAHLFTDSPEPDSENEALSVRRANGETIAVRTHMQRSTIAGRSCLVMSFFASPSISAAAIRHASAGIADLDKASDDRERETLRQEVEDLKAVIETAADGLVLLDTAGTIRSMNGSAHKLFAIAEGDSAGRPFITLFAHQSQKAASDYLEDLRHGNAASADSEGREVIGRVAEGGFVPLLLRFGRLPDESGWYAVVRDIAHRKRVEEELTTARREAEAASLQKSQFLANISHELRTPLNAIIGFADVMSAECFGPIGNERYLEYLDDIKRSGHHVLDLVNDLLDITKIEAGKLDLAFEAVSLNEVIAEVVALMQPQANRERVIVRSNLPSSVPPVIADNRSIRQIAMNLVSNAIRFTPAGGQIIVSTSYSPGGDVALRFRDSGIGMSEREIEIAMMPFRQINPDARRRGEGTGLGLPLTKALVEANRAAFAISSTPGEGTLVEILFPPQRVLTD